MYSGRESERSDGGGGGEQAPREQRRASRRRRLCLSIYDVTMLAEEEEGKGETITLAKMAIAKMPYIFEASVREVCYIRKVTKRALFRISMIWWRCLFGIREDGFPVAISEVLYIYVYDICLIFMYEAGDDFMTYILFVRG